MKLPCTPHSDDLNDVAELPPSRARIVTVSIRPKPAPKYDHGVEIYTEQPGGAMRVRGTTNEPASVRVKS